MRHKLGKIFTVYDLASFPCRFFPFFCFIHLKGAIPKFETNIPRKGIARPQYQFPHPCVCEPFIYSHVWTAYSAAGKYVDQSSRTQECGNWD